jgi:hypothetical protein
MDKKLTFTAEEQCGSGPWIDITEQHHEWLRAGLAEKRRHLELFESGKISFHSNPAPGVQIDTTPEVIARLRAEIADLEVAGRFLEAEPAHLLAHLRACVGADEYVSK